jgi:hypothetical protein
MLVMTAHPFAHAGVPLLLAVAGTTVALTVAAMPMPPPALPAGPAHLHAAQICIPSP